MKTNAKSVQIFEVRIWSKKHYKLKNTKQENMYSGCITDIKSKQGIWFKSPAKLLTALEELYKKAEK